MGCALVMAKIECLLGSFVQVFEMGSIEMALYSQSCDSSCLPERRNICKASVTVPASPGA